MGIKNRFNHIGDMNEIFIYTLSDPNTGEIKYVGRTKNLAKRIRGHILKNEGIEKQKWISDLKRKNLKPIIEILDFSETENANWLERYWTQQLFAWGYKLTNDNNTPKEKKRYKKNPDHIFLMNAKQIMYSKGMNFINLSQETGFTKTRIYNIFYSFTIPLSEYQKEEIAKALDTTISDLAKK